MTQSQAKRGNPRFDASLTLQRVLLFCLSLHAAALESLQSGQSALPRRSGSTRTMSQSSVTSLSILCGSQLLEIDPLQLNRFRETVREDSQLSFLQVALSQLVDVWEVASESFQAQWRPPQKIKLATLQAFLNGQDTLGAIDNQKNNNILLAPLTVALQIVKLLHKSPDSSISSLFQADRRVENVQGFCIGFLTAIVIAYSSDEAQFRILCNKAINLAMCIGAIVDNSEDSIADSNLKRTSLAVRWKSESHEKRMKQLVDQYPDVRCLNSFPSSKTNHEREFQNKQVTNM